MDPKNFRQYLEKHDIHRLFEGLTTAVLIDQPADPYVFLAAALAKLRDAPTRNPEDLSSIIDSGVSTKPAPASAIPASVIPAPAPSTPTTPAVYTFGTAISKNGSQMEDELGTVALGGGGAYSAVFGIYDGHSTDKRQGRAAAQIAKANLPHLALLHLDTEQREHLNAPDITTALSKAFTETEAIMLHYGKQFAYAGTTATLCVLGKTLGGAAQLHVGNVGDSTAILVSALGKVEVLSVDHQAKDQPERERAEAAGAFTTDNKWGLRVNGLLVTRSLGDLQCTGTICTPSVRSVVLEKNSTLVVASDGLWGAMSFDQVAQVCVGVDCVTVAFGCVTVTLCCVTVTLCCVTVTPP
eukprot:TRINITY_DN2167_c0_g1_i8.p1 TRINITY_DN2167_c0_g1~~TRINITY_DN2167_c0_g1_i8.p1  ORF type:complete len:354 (+),score=80.78 TRINITY_DN2167_c0_g1_i8:180-1241(+)